MNTIKLLSLLLLVGIFYSCEDSVEEQICNNNCADVIDYRGNNRTYENGSFRYTFILTLKMQCSGNVFEYRTGKYRSAGAVSTLEELCSEDFAKYN